MKKAAAHGERLLMMILAPIAAMLIQMAISRQREYAADAAAARYTGSPDPLINALRKLERGNEQIPMDASRRPRTCSSSRRCWGG